MILAELLVKKMTPYCERVAIAGSVRRRKPEVGDVELVYIPKEGVDPVAELDRMGLVVKRLNKLGRPTYGKLNKLMVHPGARIPVDFFATTADIWGMTMFVRTGPAEWNVKAFKRLKELGMRGYPYKGVTKAGRMIQCRDEETMFKLLRWPMRSPERRQ